MKLLPCLLVTVLASQAEATSSKLDLSRVRVASLAHELFPRWALEHPGRACPRSVHEMLRTVDRCEDDAIDPWGYRYEVLCVRSAPQPLVGVYSVGEDGLAGTADDIKSWNHRS